MKWKRKFSYLEKNKQDSNVKDIYFNGKVIRRSQKYKYLGNLLSETQTNQGDIFRYTYEQLCNKARTALFSIEKKLNHLGVLPPKIAIYLFKSNIEPVLTYGCEVWGFHKKGYRSDWHIFVKTSKNSFEDKTIHKHHHGVWRTGFHTS